VLAVQGWRVFFRLRIAIEFEISRTRLLVKGLREQFPGVLACGEMPYNALMSVLPLFHVFSAGAYPPAFKKIAARLST
jgi:hypothetical protein